jgi:hypothetical protein
VLAGEEEEWIPAEDASAVWVPQQGFSSPGVVRRWICTDIHVGCAVIAGASRVESLQSFSPFNQN